MYVYVCFTNDQSNFFFFSDAGSVVDDENSASTLSVFIPAVITCIVVLIERWQH